MALAIDLYCGLGGWTEGLLSEGFRVVGFDNERHVYGDHAYPAQMVVQDVLTLHGRQFKDASLIVASPPCQEYSYMAMPWSRAKQIRAALLGEGDFPDGYKGSRTIAELNRLFDACFRIQREACEAAGRHIPMVVENVRGAQEWVGRARWNHGSYYLWGDVPALMPIVLPRQAVKRTGRTMCYPPGSACPEKVSGRTGKLHWQDEGKKNAGFRFDGSGKSFQWESVNRHIKQGGDWFSDPSSPGRQGGVKFSQSGAAWFDGKPRDKMLGNPGPAAYGSKSPKRKMASAMIAKIPFELSRHIASVYR